MRKALFAGLLAAAIAARKPILRALSKLTGTWVGTSSR